MINLFINIQLLMHSDFLSPLLLEVLFLLCPYPAQAPPPHISPLCPTSEWSLCGASQTFQGYSYR